MRLKRVCVFCGSNHGARREFTGAAQSLGALLARQQLTLVYGGGNVGLMGEIANAVLAAGGEVIGVIPEALANRELAHKDVADMRVVRTMHERKALMAELSDAFIALPGGYGTMDELFEIVTWAQLGMHQKPCAVLNVSGFFNSLLAHLNHAAEEQFIRPAHRAMLMVESDPERLLNRMRSYQAPDLTKWIDRKTV